MPMKTTADANKADDDDTEEAALLLAPIFWGVTWAGEGAAGVIATEEAAAEEGRADEGRAEVVLTGIVTLPSL